MGFLKAKQLRVGRKLLDQHDKDGLTGFARELVFVAALLRIDESPETKKITASQRATFSCNARRGRSPG